MIELTEERKKEIITFRNLIKIDDKEESKELTVLIKKYVGNLDFR